MKKVIFISALAIAAAVSCTKSDIVDTKFNEQISFETYVGRDAMTKATPFGSQNLPDAIGLYGYYLGNNSTWETGSVANLWKNATLAPAGDGTWGVANDAKYWANDTDKYTFLAYAPVADGTVLKVDEAATDDKDGENPVLTYSVPQTPLSDQKDVLYAKAEGVAGSFKDNGVSLVMSHALARLTVKAARATNAPAAFEFDVKEVSIAGPFKTAGTFNLYNQTWDSNTGTGNTEYVFHRNGTPTTTDAGTTITYNEYNADNKLTTAAKDYAYYATTTKSDKANNYLMMIPTTFATNKATLKVVYTTFYEGQESKEIEKTFTINQDFKQGCAYAISLEFSHDTQAISFKVTVEDWKNEAGTVADPDKETDVTETPVTPAA